MAWSRATHHGFVLRDQGEDPLGLSTVTKNAIYAPAMTTSRSHSGKILHAGRSMIRGLSALLLFGPRVWYYPLLLPDTSLPEPCRLCSIAAHTAAGFRSNAATLYHVVGWRAAIRHLCWYVLLLTEHSLLLAA